MIAQGDEAMAVKGPVRVSPPRSQPQGDPNRQGNVLQGTVLILDDEEPVRETLAEVLNFHGYGAVTAASVGEAEATKQRLGAEGIHLVIADIHLTPGHQARAGYAIAQRWRAQHPGLPIILISGDPSNQDLPEVRDGSLWFLLKPFRIETFVEVVREALGG
jgi:DNA-binding NtrC family response regulator